MQGDRCEVVLYTPDHDATFSVARHRRRPPGRRPLGRAHLRARRRDRRRLRARLREPRPEVGATIPHPHGQIYAYDHVPAAPATAPRDGLDTRRRRRRPPRPSHGRLAGVGALRAGLPDLRRRSHPSEHVPDLPSLDDAGPGRPRGHARRRARRDSIGCGIEPCPTCCGSTSDRPTARTWPQAWLSVEIVSPWRAAGVQRFIAAAEVGGGEFFNPVIPEDIAEQLRARSTSTVDVGSRRRPRPSAPDSCRDPAPSPAPAATSSISSISSTGRAGRRGSLHDGARSVDSTSESPVGSRRQTIADSQVFTRRPRISFAASIRSDSTPNRNSAYSARYMTISRPGRSVIRRCRSSSRHAQIDEVAERLVEERRVERGAGRVPGALGDVGVDLQRPRQVGRPAEDLLVPPVAPPPDGLGERRPPARPQWPRRRAGCRGRLARHTPTRMPAIRPPGMPRPPSQILKMLSGSSAKRSSQLVTTWYEPRPEHAGEHRPDRDRRGVLPGADALLLEPAPEQPDRGDDAERDHQPVRPQLQRPDVDRTRSTGSGSTSEEAHRVGDLAAELDRPLLDQLLVVVHASRRGSCARA